MLPFFTESLRNLPKVTQLSPGINRIQILTFYNFKTCAYKHHVILHRTMESE